MFYVYTLKIFQVVHVSGTSRKIKKEFYQVEIYQKIGTIPGYFKGYDKFS